MERDDQEIFATRVESLNAAAGTSCVGHCDEFDRP